ncbi:probable LRR receptor-like serine/threonine-protein kinase At1g05700 isoform X1 [Zingiber officinale]|uniref:probable LRR receptor-like serine/threonine-protein kinase At1g05700 isoform X1 n=1 Tax=Zingiber officinale TaxID=94328 RepID=UPI001C4BB8CE|nr:probable LRR receptor-like serine/threonine-protein kinase At1g05700 isoform X1 [Zingiber officinale]
MKSSIITLKEKKRATTSVATLPSKMTAEWCSLLLSFAAIAVARVHCQSSEGFISIDCGIEDGSSYDDPITNLNYVSDSPYIDTGINANVSAAYATSAMELQERRFLNVRSFPNNNRNCYDITGVAMGSKYLLRATFMYGNYDGRNSRSIVFDLYLGVNLWKTINVTDPAATIRTEALAVALGESFSVCLLNTGKGTPFVSGMDVRPLKDGVYPGLNATLSAVVHNRLNMGPTSGAIRYPDDKYDRIWETYSSPQWTEISTDSTVNNLSVDGFEPPTAVMQTAVTPENSLTLNFTLELDPGDLSEIVVAVLYFSEFLTLTGNMSRRFYIYFNGARWFQKPFVPEYLLSDSVYGIVSQTGYWQYNITLQALSNSTLPPILNAMEIMAAMDSSNEATDGGDVDAISGIKESYQVKRNWRGDPCSPKDFAWDGINCTFSLSEPPRITRINLSSSGLNGTISTAFATLAAIQYLDLSYNNITGTIPGFLARLSSLKILDLTNNNLTGSIPSALLTEAQNGLLTLRLEGNPYLCTDESSCQLTPASTKKKITAPVIVILGVLPLLLVVLVVFLVWRYRTNKGYGRASHVSQQNQPIFNRIQKHQDSPLQFENRQFTYLELKNITDNFKRVLGKGGFGTVYYGCLEDGIEVAVKMRSPSTSQEPKEFLYEAQFLMRVHHKNLVSMLGFCKDGDYMGLVYDYMAQGSVENHLRGRRQNATSLSWRQRLQIALESAQGLDYLHKSCKPSIIHRDVKTANILLSETFEAKIADFGISKTLSETNTHVSTIIIGTKGYLDPEYHITGQLSRKSDVYSFGVVILELITGKPAIITSEDNVHISHWIQQRLSQGSIEDVVDARMHGEYSANSVWKCITTALACLTVLPYQRPTMANVVSQLKRSLELENLHSQNRRTVTSGETVFTSSLK